MKTFKNNEIQKGRIKMHISEKGGLFYAYLSFKTPNLLKILSTQSIHTFESYEEAFKDGQRLLRVYANKHIYSLLK